MAALCSKDQRESRLPGGRNFSWCVGRTVSLGRSWSSRARVARGALRPRPDPRSPPDFPCLGSATPLPTVCDPPTAPQLAPLPGQPCVGLTCIPPPSRLQALSYGCCTYGPAQARPITPTRRLSPQLAKRARCVAVAASTPPSASMHARGARHGVRRNPPPAIPAWPGLAPPQTAQRQCDPPCTPLHSDPERGIHDKPDSRRKGLCVRG